jgi:hypothetical protein
VAAELRSRMMWADSVVSVNLIVAGKILENVRKTGVWGNNDTLRDRTLCADIASLWSLAYSTALSLCVVSCSSSQGSVQ